MRRELAAGVDAQIALERTFWEADPFEKPGVDTLENVINKSVEAAIFHLIATRFCEEFRGASTILETGGGQGWASCIVKRLNPSAHCTLTDAVPAAVASRGIWERVFNCRLDAALAAPAQAIPLADASIDLIFCYAAAHHFVDHDAALREAWRLLKPGGRCLWLYEPTAPGLLHGIAERRVNRKRTDVAEHVMIPKVALQYARAIGFNADVQFWPNTLRQGRIESAYYLLLSFVSALRPMLPCTAHFIFQRPADAPM